MWSTRPLSPEASLEDGAAFRKTYYSDAQHVFSRVQHHVHHKTKNGFAPLKACCPKHGTQKGVCKADFPNPEKRFLKDPLILCRGLARRVGLRVSGRRNALGSILGRRTGAWQSGTHPAFATVFRSNTHTMPNYRVPILPETHEDRVCRHKDLCVCNGDKAMVTRLLKITCKLAQRAQREGAGYYCGYTFKAQPVGRKLLNAAVSSLNYLEETLQDKTPGSV